MSMRYLLSSRENLSSPNASCALNAVKPYQDHSTHPAVPAPAPLQELPHESHAHPRNPRPRLYPKVIRIWAQSWLTCPRLIARPPKRSTLNASLGASRKRRRAMLCRFRSRGRTERVFGKTRRSVRAQVPLPLRKRAGCAASRAWLSGTRRSEMIG